MYVLILDGASKERRREQAKKCKREKKEEENCILTSIFTLSLAAKKVFFQDGLKVFCLLLIGIAEYRVYRTTVVEKHSKNLILKPFEFSRKKSTLES